MYMKLSLEDLNLDTCPPIWQELIPVKWYIGRDRKMENNFKDCLIFREKKLSSKHFREQIIYFTTITK